MKHKLKFMVAGLALSILLTGGTAFAQDSAPAPESHAHGFSLFDWSFGWGNDSQGPQDQNDDQNNGDGDSNANHDANHDEKNDHVPLISGSITSISSTTLTVSGVLFPPKQNATTTVYSVDTAHAQITKDGRPAVLSALVNGDKVMIEGSATGTQVTASLVRAIGEPQDRGANSASTTTVIGTVASTSGTNFALTLRRGLFGTETLSVNASNASIVGDDNATTTLGSIVTGDHALVRGILSGNTLIASLVHDLTKREHRPVPPMSMVPGTGAPLVGGTVTAVGSTTITITNHGATTYTIDTASSTLIKRGAGSSTISNISTGDHILVQGNVNGSSITASSIIDEGAASSTHPTPMPHGKGILGAIGGFISHLFGFF